jgi:hypothetical protein
MSRTSEPLMPALTTARQAMISRSWDFSGSDERFDDGFGGGASSWAYTEPSVSLAA